MDDRTVPDLGAVFDEHVADEFVVRDVAATMATMTPEPTVLHVPSGAGGSGHGFRDGKVDYEHLYWDQASLLVQIGLLDPAGLPVLGVEQARALSAAGGRPGAGVTG